MKWADMMMPRRFGLRFDIDAGWHLIPDDERGEFYDEATGVEHVRARQREALKAAMRELELAVHRAKKAAAHLDAPVRIHTTHAP